ncbi:hypothetical protein [Streptomyces sp. H39-C1]|uniref:hypothetical protein n=1 Tax=Streptomyces sp. H39-C1 TaxID=3004355 RepID=UPI0022AEF724|nr:hypothetical protein [Streptomyces sp. H39-C1]MCZ4101207.1 hypothetical protein [Streptomyces sp. H39-C1]
MRLGRVVAALCVVLLSGCTGNAHTKSTAAAVPTTVPAVAGPASIQQIAAVLGCKAEISVVATELRQGSCRTGQGEFRMLTFAAETGQRDWLTEAQAYGGIYLVGTRWIVTAQSQEALKGLRATLGGTIQAAPEHAGHGG